MENPVPCKADYDTIVQTWKFPGGLCGNEDMLAVVMVCTECNGDLPGHTRRNGKYMIGSPLFEKLILRTEKDKDFTVIARNNSDKNIYIQSAKLNELFQQRWISHDEIVNGGTWSLK